MKILDRVFLMIFSLTIFGLSAGVAIISLHLFSDEILQDNLVYLYSRWEPGVIALLIALIALRMLVVSCKSNQSTKKHDAMIVMTELGQVNVTISAIKNLLTKSVQAIGGVRHIEVGVDVCNQPKHTNESSIVKIHLKVIVGPDKNIPELSNQIRQLVVDRMRQVIGIDKIEVDVCIEDISNTVGTKPRVV